METPHCSRAWLTGPVRERLSRPFEVVVDSVDESFHSRGCRVLVPSECSTVTTTVLELLDHDSWWHCETCVLGEEEPAWQLAFAFWGACSTAARAVSPESVQVLGDRLRAAASALPDLDLATTLVVALSELEVASSRTAAAVNEHASWVLDLEASLATFPGARFGLGAMAMHAFDTDLTLLEDPFGDRAAAALPISSADLTAFREHHLIRTRTAGTSLLVRPGTNHFGVLTRLSLEHFALEDAPGAYLVRTDFAESCTLLLQAHLDRAGTGLSMRLAPGDGPAVVETAARLALDGLTPEEALEAARAL